MTDATLAARAKILAEAISIAFEPRSKRTLKHTEAMSILARCDGLRNRHVQEPTDAHAATDGTGRDDPNQAQSPWLAARLSLTRHAVVGWGPQGVVRHATDEARGMTERLRATSGLAVTSDLFARPEGVPADHEMIVFHVDFERARSPQADRGLPNDGSAALMDRAWAEKPGSMVRSLLEQALFGRRLGDGEIASLRQTRLPVNCGWDTANDLALDTYCYEYNPPNMCVSDYERANAFVTTIERMRSLETAGFSFCLRTFAMADVTIFNVANGKIWGKMTTGQGELAIMSEDIGADGAAAAATRALDSARRNLGIALPFDGASLLAAIERTEHSYIEQRIAIRR